MCKILNAVFGGSFCNKAVISYVYIPSIIHINRLIIDLVYMFLSLFFFQEHENVALLLLDKIHDSNICNIANSELKT